MRCDNCGWSNPDGLTKCQKCNQDLVPPVPVSPASVQTAASNAINQTIIDPSRSGAVLQPSSTVSCSRCGYPLSSAASFCPNCGTEVKQTSTPHSQTVRVLPEEFLDSTPTPDPVEVNLKATVREIPVELMENTRFSQTVRVLPEEMLVDEEPAEPVKPVEPSFKLVPMDNFDGATPKALEYSGASSCINGSSLVSEGAYMPEGVEMEFTCVDGQWSVLDKSGAKNIFVSTSRPVQLQSGDVVVVGNRRFIFE